MLITPDKIAYTRTPPPPMPRPAVPVDLTDATMAEHREKILRRMAGQGLDVLVVYGDREHGANFGYLAGFEPRFEEAVIVLHQNGDAFLLLGNESLRMGAFSRLAATALHTPFFSLPNQPMDGEAPLDQVFAKAGIGPGARVGVAGWKMFTATGEDNAQIFDVPHFIVAAVQKAAGGAGRVENAAPLFIHPESGARAVGNANEIAHYEFGAALASGCVFSALEALALGKTELELAAHLAAYGQPPTVQTICATGERFTNAVVAPRAKAVQMGDRFSCSMGLRGGLTSRAAYVAAGPGDLPPEAADYLERVAKPYYAAAATWYSTVQPGLTGGQLYAAVETVAPKAQYGWKLNPGHLTASEEWMSSPVAAGSAIPLQSGMMLQMDIIFSVPGYGGCNAEDGVALADDALRAELAQSYPETFARIAARRAYMEETLGIPLHPSVLPLANTCGWLRPLLLARDTAFRVEG